MPLFGSSKKNPVEIVKNARDAFMVLEKEEHGKKSEKVITILNQCFQQFME